MLEGVSGYFSPLWKQYRWYILTSKRSLNLTGPVRGKTLIRRIKLNEVKYQSSSLTPDMPFLGWSGWRRGHDWHGPLSCSQLNSHVHIQRWYWPLTPGPDAITIFESHRASGLVHNTININVLWLRRLWKNFLPHQYWWCCHTLESGPSLRIYKRNGGCGGGGGGVGGFGCLYANEANAIFGRHLGDVHFPAVQSNFRGRGVAAAHAWWDLSGEGLRRDRSNSPRNALPEMIVMEKWTFHFRGSGNAKWGCVDSGEGGIAFGTSSQTVHCRATHVDTDPIHYNISFGDALLYISSVKRACSKRVSGPGSFVMHSDINHTESVRKKHEEINETQNELWLCSVFVKHSQSLHL